MFIEPIKLEYERVCKEINQIEAQLKSLPDGKLICGRSGKYYKWYRTDGHKKEYIPKKDQALAEKLAAKKYLLCKISDLKHQKNVLETYLKSYPENPGKADNLLLKNSEYKKLITPFLNIQDSKLKEWAAAPYERNTSHPEQLIHMTASGNLVRSKSETLIDLYLYKNQIPFRYECALHLGETTLYPDFTILHPKTRKMYYYEHFGLMDKQDYAQKACLKLQTYISHGIIPSIQLITTYETKSNPLSIDMIEKIIKHYFL